MGTERTLRTYEKALVGYIKDAFRIGAGTLTEPIMGLIDAALSDAFTPPYNGITADEARDISDDFARWADRLDGIESARDLLAVDEVAAMTSSNLADVRAALESHELHGIHVAYGNEPLVQRSCIVPWMQDAPCEHQSAADDEQVV